LSAPAALLLFEVDGRRFGADPRDVVIVGAGAADVDAERVVTTALGAAREGSRSLVVACEGGKRELVIDRVLGLRTLGAGEWHELPALASLCLPTRALRGLLLEGRLLTPVVDLPRLLGEPPPDARPEPA